MNTAKTLSVFALGGINEIGKNMYVLEYGDDLLVIDSGSKFQQHRALAESVGVEGEDIFIINNGDVVDIEQSTARQTRNVQAGHVFVDGLGGVGEVGKMILRDRKLLSEEGMLLIILTMSKTDGKLLTSPDTISRGFVYERGAEELYKELDELVVTIVKDSARPNRNRRNDLKHAIRKSVEKLLFARTKKRPMIVPFIIEI
ncbi:predicted hydrolase of the metallo-beta-lactamase superfamily [Bacillus sp. OxB-1]|uniref:hypothetical protein n=1 Tax=Bacillus sp. (strain OxB-1) TaxID=98228 RepID=UPI000581FCC5|nr:hypothetical protein [Bacillus sp. OxB-1]BAQ08917.1 predicted hydrolase of the metallo-beta-lactamase superfamily [Bacillus sp. OxB-1]